MCYECWNEERKPQTDNKRVRDAARAIAKVYEYSCVGGNLHIAIDDCNFEDGNLDFCEKGINNPEPPFDTPELLEAERECLGLLRGLTYEERCSAVALHGGLWQSPDYPEERQTPSTDAVITEVWLKEVGFKWHQLERQPNKQWLLWLGEVCDRSFEDLGIEVAPNISMGEVKDWFCWLRSDSAGRYHRFIHLRHIKTQADLIGIIEGISGQQWNPDNNLYGWMRTPEHAQKIRSQSTRLDMVFLEQRPKWHETEKDESRGGPLLEHRNYYADQSEGRG